MRIRRTLGVGLVALLLSGCVAEAASARTRPAPLPRATIQARIHLLGAANVNARTGQVRRDKVVFSWYGISNFVAAVRGHVVILDSFLRRGYNLGQIDTTLEELAALKPELIFIGHSHYDHAIDSGELAAKSGAPIVGMPTHCQQIRRWAQIQGNDTKKVRCITAMPDNVPLGKTTTRTDLIKGVPITILRHVHFPYTPAAPTGLGQTGLNEKGGPEFPCPQEPQWEGFPRFPATTQDLKNVFVNVAALASSWIPNEGGGSLLYQFHVGKLNITWHDTQGTLDYYPQVTKALRALPRTDIELGSIASLQRPTDCLHDVRLYWLALRTKVFVPTHSDASDPTESNAAFYKPFLAEEAGRVPAAQRPCIHMIEDPQHYLNPSVLTWRARGPARCAPRLTVPPVAPQGTPHPDYGVPPAQKTAGGGQ